MIYTSRKYGKSLTLEPIAQRQAHFILSEGFIKLSAKKQANSNTRLKEIDNLIVYSPKKLQKITQGVLNREYLTQNEQEGVSA